MISVNVQNQNWFSRFRALATEHLDRHLLGNGDKTMQKWMRSTTALVTAAACAMGAAMPAYAAKIKGPTGVVKIGHVVVIYAENHSFDEEFGSFPGVNGLKN